jgi:hypothetical protein
MEMSSMKNMTILLMILCASLVWAKKGSVPDFSPTCLNLKDKRCTPAPKLCANGSNYCSEYQGVRYAISLVAGNWTNTGVFKARGEGKTCAEAQKDADNTFHFKFSSLCNEGPEKECKNGYSYYGFNCYRQGNQIIAWRVCDNSPASNGKAKSGAKDGTVGFLLYNSMRRREVSHPKRR